MPLPSLAPTRPEPPRNRAQADRSVGAGSGRMPSRACARGSQGMGLGASIRRVRQRTLGERLFLILLLIQRSITAATAATAEP
jgi:hypothetical protein